MDEKQKIIQEILRCDLIVCWIHDWEDSPMEVLELKSVMSQLPKKQANL